MIYNKVEKKSSLKALKELKENAQEVCEWELDRLNIIEKDLEILEILKKNTIIIKDKEEYNKVKDWLIHNDL